MMLLATWHDAVPMFGISALLLAASALPFVLGVLILRSERAWRRFPRYARHVAAALVVIAGLPLYACTAFFVLIAIATVGCAPGAYECPI
jgi:hypothetical protein